MNDRIRDLLAQGGNFELDEILKILRSLAGALDTLHGSGLIHGDIKPGNILFDAELDRVVLIDFGMVKLFTKGEIAFDRFLHSHGGTAGFCPLEQLDSNNQGLPNTTYDTYSLAAIAYLLLTKQKPFPGSVDLRVAAQREVRFTPPSQLRSELSPGINEVWRERSRSVPNCAIRPATSWLMQLSPPYAAQSSCFLISRGISH